MLLRVAAFPFPRPTVPAYIVTCVTRASAETSLSPSRSARVNLGYVTGENVLVTRRAISPRRHRSRRPCPILRPCPRAIVIPLVVPRLRRRGILVNEVSFSFVPFLSVVYRSLLLHAETLYWHLTLSLSLPPSPSSLLVHSSSLSHSLSLLLSAILFHFFSFSFSSLSHSLPLLPPPSFSSRFLSLPILCFSSLFLPFYLYLRAYIYTSHM